MTVAIATPSEIDRSLAELREGARRWIDIRPDAKAALLKDVFTRVYRESARWAEAGARAKGIDGTPLAGEEWLSGPWALMYALERYIDTLQKIATGSPVLAQSRVHTRADGQVVAECFPNTFYDGLLLSGIRGEVWMQRGVTADNLSQTIGVWYKQPNPQPRVALVLGAGNIASIPPLDVLYKLVADGTVCILKMNPVNEYLGPILEDALAPLVDGGYLRFAYGGPDIGKQLCAHDLVDEIHITGSDKTHDAIVFGAGAERAARKAANTPQLQKPITSELGNVSPTIVVPGPWSQADFRFQAEQIVTQKMHNGGFNCIASQVLIAPRDWDGTPKLLEQIDAVMREVLDRPAYYPGADDRVKRLTDGREAKRYGIGRTVVAVDAQSADPAFEIEAFSSLLAVTQLPGDTASYLSDAVKFANERLWGTLGANIVIHPATMRTHATDLDRAVADLRYGCIAVNAWTGLGFLLTDLTWGAYPGHPLNDVRSGIGVVHNAYLFDRAEKSVVYAPFAPFPRSVLGYGATMLPKPPWFVTNKMADKVGAAFIEFSMHKTPLNATKVAMLAMRG
jgi:aldehyde dehydrogenase (NAD(P)+)